MHNVFVFGAGTSVHAGAPTMRTFIDTADRVRLTSTSIDRAAFDDVFTAIAELYPVFAKAHLDLDNIESLFGAIDMGDLLGRFGNRTPASIATLRKSIRTVIVQTLEQSMAFNVRGAKLFAASEMQTLAEMVQQVIAKKEAPAETFAFLTFNYDILIDVAFSAVPLPFTYALEHEPASGVPLLKLHGSTNWGMCPKCDRVAVRYVSEAMAGRANGRAKFIVSNDLGAHKACGTPISTPPVLVPPTWDKAQYHSTIGCVWKRAAEELSRAERLYIVGYSLPETDSFFRYLFALGTAGTARLQQIVVVDPDVEKLRDRYLSMIGRGIQSRVEFAKGTFGQFTREFALTFEAKYREPDSNQVVIILEPMRRI